MKTQIKRFSKSTLAIVLTLCMLVSCMTVGIIATDAAKVDSEATGATTYYLWYSSTNNITSTSSWTKVAMTASNNNYVSQITINRTGNYYIFVSTSNTSYTSNVVNGSTGLTTTGSFSASGTQEWNDGTIRYMKYFATTSASGTVTVTYSTSNTINLSTVSSGAQDLSSKVYHITGSFWSSWPDYGAGTGTQMTYDEDNKLLYWEKTNISYKSGGYLFRVLTTTGYPQTLGDSQVAGFTGNDIATRVTGASDNNIKFTTDESKGNFNLRVEVYNDGSDKINVIVTPAVGSVTPGTSTGGKVQVNGGNIKVSDIAYGASVDVKAVPDEYYHFSKWTNDTTGKITYANANAASTTAVIKGDATATAEFAKDQFNVAVDSDGTYTLSVDKKTVVWGDTVTVTATPKEGKTITKLYYQKADGTQTTISGTTSGSFTMPTESVTVYAVTADLANGTVTYGTSGNGAVSVGYQYGSTQNQITKSITSGDTVLQNKKVNFCAIPDVDNKFVGWYTNPACTTAAPASLFTTGSQTTKDVTVTMPGSALSLYAKFAEAPDIVDDSLVNTTGTTLLIRSDNSDVYLWAWKSASDTTQISGATSWPGKKVSDLESVTINKVKYYKFVTSNTNFQFILNLGNNSNQSKTYTITAGKGTYYATYAGHDANVTWSAYTAPKTVDPDKATDQYYPVTLNYYDASSEENGTAHTYAYVKSGSTVTVDATPADDYEATYSFDGGAYGTTKTKSNATAAVSAVVKFTPLPYYTVNFSAGPHGGVTAKVGSTAITSGTTVKKGTSVTFTAAADTGYAFAQWTGSSTGTSSSITLTINADTTVKGYFKESNDGTLVSEVYMAYSTSDGNFAAWTTTKRVYQKDGRAYAYIDNPGTSRYYFTISSTSNPSTDNNDGNGRGSWTYKKSSLKCVTDFSQYVSVKVGNYVYNNGSTYGGYKMTETWTQYNGEAQAVSGVSRLIIDLGSWNGSSITMDNDTYRVIPVYDTDATNVDVYAKNGSYRGDSAYDYWSSVAKTTITSTTGVTNIKDQTNFYTAAAVRGSTVKVTTTINTNSVNSVTNRNRFYVRGFSVNGVTPEVYEWNSSGVYTLEYKIPTDFAYDYLEITPIFFLKDTANTVNFVIENYDQDFMDTGWGNTLSIYPYYTTSKGDVNRKDNAFGGYPGQPVVNYGGRRYIQIPISFAVRSNGQRDSSDYAVGDTATIKGITLSNDYFDIVHRQYCKEVDTHLQTYDYDDFNKLATETAANAYPGQLKTGIADQITFAFKYRTNVDNAIVDSFTTAEKLTKYTNGWETYLNYYDQPIDIFGKVLTEEEQKKDPLLIVSNGYARTYAGYYATEWTIYKKSSDGTKYEKLQTTTPSALEVATAARVGTDSNKYPVYPASVGRGPGYPTITQLYQYNAAYTALEAYRGYPAEITYEKELSNFEGTSYYHSYANEQSTRSDGRWYYSYEGQPVKADIRIEYRAQGSDRFVTDEFVSEDSNKGTVTHAKAYFDGSDGTYGASYDGKTTTEPYSVLSSSENYWRFTAECPSNYVFAGWWFEKDGIATRVTEDDVLKGQSQMLSNSTFIARFVEAPSGQLEINHTLFEGSTGKGTTYISGVSVSNSESGVLQLISDPVENRYIVPSDYIKYKSGNKISITLKTVPDKYTSFDRFICDDRNTDFFSTVKYIDDDGVATTTITFDVDELFEVNNSIPSQKYTQLFYYSNLTKDIYTYVIQYSYNSRLYDQQGYMVKGTFTDEELDKYITFAEVTDKTSQETVDGIKFTSSALRKEFLQKKSPYEDNYRQTVKWDYDDAAENYYHTNQQISMIVDSSQSNNNTVNIVFQFPFRYTAKDKGFIPTTDSEGRIVYTPDTVQSMSNNTRYEKWYTLNNIYTTNDPSGAPQFVEAPAFIYDEDTGKNRYFTRWDVYERLDDTGKKGSYIATCYNRGFNLTFYQDSVVVAIYENESAVNGQQSADNAADYARVNFLENSRNQWNNGEGGSVKSDWQKYGDRIYSDFMLDINYKNEDIRLNTNSKVKVGMLFEAVGELDKDEDGNYYTKTGAQYKEQYASTEAKGLENVNTYLTDPESESLSTEYLVGTVNKAKFDNKHRLEYYYTFANISQKNGIATERKNYVYRAYLYLEDSSVAGAPYRIISDPVYFTIYDIASIESDFDRNNAKEGKS